MHSLQVMASYSKKIFTFIEKAVGRYVEMKNKAQFPPPPLLVTSFDDAEADRVNSKKSTFTKRQVGRLKKWTGDCCLQLCALGDAMEQYLGSISDLRNVVDNIWLAGALEGLSTAILLVLKMGLPIEDFLGKELTLAASVSAVSVEVFVCVILTYEHKTIV